MYILLSNFFVIMWCYTNDESCLPYIMLKKVHLTETSFVWFNDFNVVIWHHTLCVMTNHLTPCFCYQSWPPSPLQWVKRSWTLKTPGYSRSRANMMDDPALNKVQLEGASEIWKRSKTPRFAHFNPHHPCVSDFAGLSTLPLPSLSHGLSP